MSAVILVLVGCERGRSGDLRADVVTDSVSDATWIGRTPSGVVIRVRHEQRELMAGVPIRFEIFVDSARADHPVTADLLAPEMPAHGISRYEAVQLRPGVYALELEIPMEGKWELYVNLDDGSDAAAFPFAVAPSVGSAQPHHASHSGGAQQHPH